MRLKQFLAVFFIIFLLLIANAEYHLSTPIGDDLLETQFQIETLLPNVNASDKADGFEENELVSHYLTQFADGTNGGMGPFASAEQYFFPEESEIYLRQKELYDDLLNQGIRLDIDIRDTEFVTCCENENTLLALISIEYEQGGVNTQIEKKILFAFDEADGFPIVCDINVME